MGQTLAEKVWDAHIVHAAEGEPDLLYIDLHLVHEVTSPQAFEGLRQAGRCHGGCAKHLNRFVQNADAARLSHGAILDSRMLGCPSSGAAAASRIRAPGTTR